MAKLLMMIKFFGDANPRQQLRYVLFFFRGLYVQHGVRLT
jgi:hypothetical protein